MFVFPPQDVMRSSLLVRPNLSIYVYISRTDRMHGLSLQCELVSFISPLQEPTDTAKQSDIWVSVHLQH